MPYSNPACVLIAQIGGPGAALALSFDAGETRKAIALHHLRGGLETDMDAGSRGQGDEHFKTKLLLFSSHQIGHPGLTDLKELGRLGLRQLLGLDDLPQGRHEIGTHLKDRGFVGRKAQVEKYVAGRAENIFGCRFHFTYPFTGCREKNLLKR